MTDEEMDKIDAAVHRHIMESETSPAEFCTCGNKSPDYRGSYCLACGYPIAPEYTRSWSDAGEVVEKLLATGHAVTVWSFAPDDHSVDVYKNGLPQRAVGRATAPTAPPRHHPRRARRGGQAVEQGMSNEPTKEAMVVAATSTTDNHPPPVCVHGFIMSMDT